MAYIYVITNQINGKQYVGKTNTTIEERWRHHQNDSERYASRPLYRAFKKYGIENFSIKELEQCSSQEAPSLEIYWIGKLNTYENGYNATRGGDGSTLYDYKELAEAYLKYHNLTKVAEYFQCDPETVRRACLEYDIEIQNGGAAAFGKAVIMCDKKTKEPIQDFINMTKAAEYLIQHNITTAQPKHISTSISRSANGQRKTAYGYIWKYKES